MKSLLVYNWKTYVASVNDSVALADALANTDNATVIVCPSALHIPFVAETIADKKMALGAQDIAVSADKPQTGNLSGVQLLDLGISYTLVGHAETRAAGVTNNMVADKTVHALTSGLTPIVCLSESNDDGDQNSGEEVSEQLEHIVGAIGGLSVQENEGGHSFIIAYEPTAYIGAEDALAPEKIKYILGLLRGVLRKHTSRDVPVIYGGSVTIKNAAEILRTADADGFLLGRASVTADTANTILHSLS